MGVGIALRAMEAPLRQIVENAGAEGSVVVDKARAKAVLEHSITTCLCWLFFQYKRSLLFELNKITIPQHAMSESVR